MEKKIRFGKGALSARILYAAVIAILCITAIVVGIVSAAQRAKLPDEEPPKDSTGDNGSQENEDPPEDGGGEDQPVPETPKPLAFVSPIVGSVVKHHSLTEPVFSNTLGEWRVHTGIDISAEEGASVYASEDGVVSGIYKDPLMGYTVEITHRDDIVTRYSNLTAEASTLLKVGDEVASGDKIGEVGDSSVNELAEEPHLHFEVLVRGVKMNPLDYLTEDSKSASLGLPEV